MLEWKNCPITAVSMVRPPLKPGGPTLVKADDNQHYFVKTNSEMRLDASHEAAASCVAASLGLSTPVTRLVKMHRVSGVRAGIGEGPTEEFGFGSRVLGFGHRLYDYVPEKLFGWVENLEEMVQWAVFDVWTANAGKAHPVFAGRCSEPPSIRAFKIGHSRCFGGFEVETYSEAPAREIDRYQRAAHSLDWTNTLKAIRCLSEEEVRAMLDYAPTELLNARYRDRLLEGLLVRQERLPELIARSFADSLSLDEHTA